MRTAFWTVVGVVGVVGILSSHGCGESVGGEAVVSEESGLFTGLGKGLRRDYDGDGKEDLIISTSSGTIEYRGVSPSGFSATSFNRSDLTNANSLFTYGDFNNDGKSDVIITTPGGSYEYTGKSGGGFNSNVWTNTTTAFKLGNVEFTVGDFNGDGWSDFIATTSSGSSLYTGKGTGGTNGGFNAAVWTNSSLKKGAVHLIRGNFNGDATTDLLVVTSSKTSEYTGKTGTGGFNADVWTNTSYVYGNSAFTAADFNGDGKGDVIVQFVDWPGTALFYGQAGSGFTGGSSIGIEYSLDHGPIYAGNFNGGLYWDLLVPSSPPDGTAEKLGTSGGLTTTIWVDNRFHFYDTTFIRGDYNGDGNDDFVTISINGALDVNGATEGTGKGGSGGGFNSDVWTRTDIHRDDTNVY